MNAVERMLTYGERLLHLYDEMYREPDRDKWELAVLLDPSAEQMPLAVEARWSFQHWWRVAVEIALEETGERGVAIAVPASVLFRDRIAQREALLDHITWQRLVSGVVQDCREWGFKAKKVVGLAENVADRILYLEEAERWWTRPADEWRFQREWFLRDLGFLSRYHKPPAAAAAPPEKQTGGTKEKKPRGRKGVGGRPERYTLKFIRDVVAARERDEKHAANAKRPLPPFPRWLREYCDGHSIDIRERFPPRTPGEEWSRRATRFWRAAKARLSRAGN